MIRQKRSQIELIMDQGTKMILYYRQHPCQAAYDLLGADLAPIQRPMFRDMWFKNFVMGICGRGGGKSVCTDSLCHIEDKGLVYLNEELPPIPSYLKDGEEEIIPWGQRIYTSKGFKPTKRLYLEKGIQGKQIRTQNGFINKGSNHHPLLTLDSDANFVYKSMDEFKVGDRVCIQRGQNVFGKNEIPVDDAYLLGLFIGDSCIDARYSPKIVAANEEIKKFCINYCINNNIVYKVNDDEHVKNIYSIFFNELDSFFKKYKINRTMSYNKRIPYAIRIANRESQIAFLQGYFDIDCVINENKRCISCYSVSKKFLRELQLILLNFGIISKIKKTKLTIFSRDVLSFKSLIGFKIEKKQRLLNSIVSLNLTDEIIPYIKNVCQDIQRKYKGLNTEYQDSLELQDVLFDKKVATYDELHLFVGNIHGLLEKGYIIDEVYLKQVKLLEDILYYNYYFDTVKSIQDWTGDCYDFEMDMDEEPNYFANGFVNHNTYLLGLIATLSCLLFPGFRAGLISGVFRQSLIIKSGTYDTFWTDEGLKSTAQEFYDSVEEGVTKTQSLESQNTILSKWRNPERACRSIKTTKGFELGGTVDHEILVLDEELNLVFKELQEITEDDNIVIKKGFDYFGDDLDISGFHFKKTSGSGGSRLKTIKIPTVMDPDLAYFFGLLCGDGHIPNSNAQNKGVFFYNSNKELIEKLIEILEEKFAINYTKYNDPNRVMSVQVYSVMLWQFVKYLGMSPNKAPKKDIMGAIKKSTSGCIAAFLSGLYDTDGCCVLKNTKNNNSCSVDYSTTSKQLAKEVQAVLLNFGIISSLRRRSNGGKKVILGRTVNVEACYMLSVTGWYNLKRFDSKIGFRVSYKNSKLKYFINTVKGKYIGETMPNSFYSVNRLALDCRKVNTPCDLKYYISSNKRHKKTNFSRLSIDKLLSCADQCGVMTDEYYKLKKIVDLDLSFVKMKESNYFFASTIDVEVENESCYWSNGMISHNSKMIFAEVEKLYAQSSIFKEAAEKRPIRGTDTCYVRFKSVGGQPPSYIEALPLGTDGSKIRGSRFYLLLIDELAQIPTKIIDLVLRPMGSVALAPMERVRRLEQKNKLIRLGLASDRDFEDESVNKMIMTSSAFYKFNHMWTRMKDHWSQMDLAEKNGVESQYAVWQIPYWDLPEGFLDTTNIAEAKRIMSSAEFKMEYEAEMISDSEGFFKASLLEGCTNNSGFSIELKGKAADQYIVGIDPNQGGNASCGIVVIKVGAIKHIVNVLELKRLTTQDSTQVLQKLCDDYNVIRIFMDSRGGGNALRDLLEEGYGGVEPIIDRTNPEHKHVEGRHILEMVDFNSRWISDANFVTKALLEDKKLLFPEPPQTVSDLEGKRYENINMLKSQMLNIVVTQTGAGHLHFDTPRKMQNKDLYSAIILAAHGAREFEKEFEEETVVLYNSGGLIRERKPGATFNPITNQGPVVIKTDIGPAILKGKRRIK